MFYCCFSHGMQVISDQWKKSWFARYLFTALDTTGRRTDNCINLAANLELNKQATCLKAVKKRILEWPLYFPEIKINLS